VTTPYLLSASQFDKYQLPYNEGGTMPPYLPGTPQLAFADGFQGLVRSVVLNLPTPTQPRSAVYSSACFKHCTSNMGAFWGVKVDDVSLKDYLQSWYFDAPSVLATAGGKQALGLPAGVPAQRIEACIGFGCGQCHSRIPVGGPPLPPAHTASLLAPGPGGAPAALGGMGMSGGALLAQAEAEAPRRVRFGGGGGGKNATAAAAGPRGRSAARETRLQEHAALVGIAAALVLCCACCAGGGGGGGAEVAKAHGGCVASRVSCVFAFPSRAHSFVHVCVLTRARIFPLLPCARSNFEMPPMRETTPLVRAPPPQQQRAAMAMPAPPPPQARARPVFRPPAPPAPPRGAPPTRGNR
jgi:hypothetical protein